MKPHDPSCERHHCHASGCGAHVPPKLLMCARHWSMVPRDVQRAVYSHFRPGQVTNKNPTPEWHRAADMAICAVAHAEYPTLAPPHRHVDAAEFNRE